MAARHTRASAYAAHRLRRARSCAGRWRLDGDSTLTTFHEPFVSTAECLLQRAAMSASPTL